MIICKEADYVNFDSIAVLSQLGQLVRHSQNSITED